MNLKTSLLMLGVLLAIVIIRCPAERVDRKDLMSYLEAIEDNKENDFDDEDELAESDFDDDYVNYDDMDRVSDPKPWFRRIVRRVRIPRIPRIIPRIPRIIPRIPRIIPRIPRIPRRWPRFRGWGKK